MNLQLTHFLIVCPLVCLAGYVDAIAGGGGLISLPAYLLCGLPVHNAIATNKMSSSMGTAVATARYAHSGFIPWRQALKCTACAILGSVGGAKLALLVDDFSFKVIMLVILPLTELYVLFRKDLLSEKEPFSPGRTLALSMVIALVIGVYDGFYGPGTGTFLLLFLTGAAHMKLNEANGVTKFINLTTNLSALTVYLLNGVVLLPLGIAAGCFNIVGNYLGCRSFERGGARAVKPVMLLVLVAFFIRVLLEVLEAV